jgi:hypothetical protein
MLRRSECVVAWDVPSLLSLHLPLLFTLGHNLNLTHIRRDKCDSRTHLSAPISRPTLVSLDDRSSMYND